MKKFKLGKPLQRLVSAVLLPSFAMVSGPVMANPAGPSGADIDAANVVVSGLGTATVDINNFNQHAIVNWESFSIQQGEVARFNQGANAAILNRVITNNPTEIYGRLEASQGNVFLLNPNGVLVGAGGVVDVAGLMTMSTLDVDDNDFRNGGDLQFSGSSTTGITNFGTISSANGDVVLMGGFVDNKSGGQIGALNGTVAIGSGGDIILHEGGGTRISVRGSSDYTGTGIDNQGEVEGASVEMKAHGNVYALAINNGSTVRATGADRSGGRVRLMASGGSGNINLGRGSSIVARAGEAGGDVDVRSTAGAVAVEGNIEAVGSTAGGTVSVVGRTVTQGAGSLIDASGAQAAGAVAVDAEESVELAGTVRAEGLDGAGGEIAVTANRIVINDGADLSADGATTGGRLRIGGDFQGSDTGLREADSLRVETGARFSADSENGDAGTVIFWANQDTIHTGEISARAKGSVGNGGLVEVSGKQFLYFDGSVAVDSVGGNSGMVLFDPGSIVIGAAGTTPIGSPLTVGGVGPLSTVSIASINNTLQGGAHVLIVTGTGDITFDPVAGGGAQAGTTGHDRHAAIQWTNSNSSFGAFASGNINVNNHIRTSGAGSINLLAGWGGTETDAFLVGPGTTWDGNPQSAWDHYLNLGQFGNNSGSVFIGSAGMVQHVEVGSRFGDTNVAGFDVQVRGAIAEATLHYAQLGFHDGGQAFAPTVDLGDGRTLDLREGDGGAWYLSDGKNTAGQAAAGVNDPIVAVVGNAYGQEVDINGDGIIDGVHGINSEGVLTDTFIPYASHYNSVTTGNWWWQQIEAAGVLDEFLDPLYQKADPLGLGGLRPEHGAGVGALSSVATATLDAAELAGVDLSGFELNGANINVIAKRDVLVQGGSGLAGTGAMIGHGGSNFASTDGSGSTIRNISNDAVSDASFSNQTVQGDQLEQRWSFNGTYIGTNGSVAGGTTAAVNGTVIGRLAPVYGNITVLAGVNTATFGELRANGPTSTGFGTAGNVTVSGNQILETASPSTDSPAQIGHGGAGQAGEFNGTIWVEAAGAVNVLAGNASGSFAAIGHTVTEGAFWNLPTNADQQLRFFATVGDMDNPNLRRGELFTGVVTTGFDPLRDPVKTRRYTLADYEIIADPDNPGQFIVQLDALNTGNFRPEIDPLTGIETGNFVNIHDPLVIIPINPLLYTRGFNGGGVQEQGLNSLAPLTLSQVTVDSIPIAALDGSMVNGLHGNVKVHARSGDLRLEGYSTQDHIGSLAREHRFAVIGHGGRSDLFAGQGAGYQNISSGVPEVPNAVAPLPAVPDGREIVNYHTNGANGDTSGSRAEYGATGTNISRRQNFMTISGDIDVSADLDITLLAGNDIYDYTRIGHGGVNLADYETSSLILGDIRVDAGGNITVTGGGLIQPVNRGSTSTAAAGTALRNYELRAWSQIGHGGFESGFFGFLGDIEVTSGLDITLLGGAHSISFAKIGHQGRTDYGQSGGSMIRDENFRLDGVSSDIETRVTATGATVVYSSRNGHSSSVVGDRVLTAGTLLSGLGRQRNTADIQVEAGGSVTMEHLDLGERQPQARLDWLGVTALDPNFNPNNQAQGVTTRNSYVQIGHGGFTTIAFEELNRATNYGDKIGNITVNANAGDIVLENGAGDQRWTRIGHGVGRGTQTTDSSNAGYSRAVELAGNISISASGDVSINAAAADDDERPEDLPEGQVDGNNNTAVGSNPSRYNPVAIGHGGVDGNRDIVVLGRGEMVNEIAASSDITVETGGNLEILGGSGVETSFAQLGHGYGSDTGNDAARRLGVATGFAGDIKVTVGGDLTVKSGDNAWTEQPGTIADAGQSVVGAFAAIGHGGYQLDAPSFGDIDVYVGGNLDITAQVRTDGYTDQVGTAGLYVVLNSTPFTVGDTEGLAAPKSVASAFNFAKIGHFSAENANRAAGTGDQVASATLTGDITVVVAGDLGLTGGKIVGDDLTEAGAGSPIEISYVDTRTIYGAFAQIGHGGPGITGSFNGDITVLVKGDIAVEGGSNIENSSFGATREMNNYAMIGNGDYIKDAVPSGDYIFRQEASGNRTGNIIVAAGENATFDGSLVGHADPALSRMTTFGNTLVAASRNSPYYTGTGSITAINGSVFSSGAGVGPGGGTSSQMSFFVPARSNNLMDADGTTRINEGTVTFGTALTDFADDPGVKPFIPADEIVAGRGDEVYLTPDLWWDDLGLVAAAGFPAAGVFPTSTDSLPPAVHGGSILLVDAPGGIPNMTALVEGAIGSSASLYRDNNGVFGAGRYTLYYDAIGIVTATFPAPPIPPFTGTLPNGVFDSLNRDDRFIDDEYTGAGDELFPGLALSENDEDSEGQSEIWSLENPIDRQFGKRRGSTTQEEEDEEAKARARKRKAKIGPIGLTYYVYDPATNKYSSYRVFGHQASTFGPVN